MGTAGRKRRAEMQRPCSEDTNDLQLVDAPLSLALVLWGLQKQVERERERGVDSNTRVAT